MSLQKRYWYIKLVSNIVLVEPKYAKPVQNSPKQPKKALKSLKFPMNNDKYFNNYQCAFYNVITIVLACSNRSTAFFWSSQNPQNQTKTAKKS